MEHSREAVIDLGTYRHDPGGAGPEPDPPWPGWQRLRRLPLRCWLPPVLVLLLLAPLAGAGGVTPPALERLWTLPGDPTNTYRLAADEQHLYAPNETGTGWVLTAHRVGDGRVDWRAPIEGGGDAVVDVLGSVPVVTASGRTTAYDPGTGRELWSYPGYVFQVLAGHLLLTQDMREDEFTITAVAPQTGETAGTLRVSEPERQRAVRESPTGVIEVFTLANDGLLTRYDVASGETLAAARTPHLERLRARTENTLALTDGVLMVVDRVADPPVVATYDPVTLEPAASVTVEGLAMPCGPVVCLARQAQPSPSVRAVDPMTGRTAWEVSCEECTRLTPAPQPGELVWLEGWVFEAGSDAQVPRSWMVGARNGEPLTEPIAWSIRQPPAGRGALLNRRDGGEVIEPNAPPTRIWWAWWDADRERPTVLGAVEAYTCASYLPYLVCAAAGEQMTVWRIRP